MMKRSAKRSALAALHVLAFALQAGAATDISLEHFDSLARFWQENDGKTVRRLPM